MNIPFASFVPMHEEIRQGLDAAFKKVVDKSYFIQGEECEKLICCLLRHKILCWRSDWFGCHLFDSKGVRY